MLYTEKYACIGAILHANVLQWWNKDVDKSVKETGWGGQGQRPRVGDYFHKGLAPRAMGLWKQTFYVLS